MVAHQPYRVLRGSGHRIRHADLCRGRRRGNGSDISVRAVADKRGKVASRLDENLSGASGTLVWRGYRAKPRLIYTLSRASKRR